MLPSQRHWEDIKEARLAMRRKRGILSEGTKGA
jgi:hypothetical protein